MVLLTLATYSYSSQIGECVINNATPILSFDDDPSFEENGCGVPVIVDMGAYEIAGECSMPLCNTV